MLLILNEELIKINSEDRPNLYNFYSVLLAAERAIRSFKSNFIYEDAYGVKHNYNKSDIHSFLVKIEQTLVTLNSQFKLEAPLIDQEIVTFNNLFKSGVNLGDYFLGLETPEGKFNFTKDIIENIIEKCKAISFFLKLRILTDAASYGKKAISAVSKINELHLNLEGKLYKSVTEVLNDMDFGDLESMIAKDKVKYYKDSFEKIKEIWEERSKSLFDKIKDRLDTRTKILLIIIAVIIILLIVIYPIIYLVIIPKSNQQRQ